MSKGNSLEVAEFLESLSRNWFIRHSLLLGAMGGVFGGLFAFGIYLVGLSGSSLVGWVIGVSVFFWFAASVFLAGIHFVVSRMYKHLLGRDFDYLCDPQEYNNRG